MLLVYTHKITPRFNYIMKHIFTSLLGIEITSTTKVEDFIKHTGPKITYTKQPLQNEFFVRSNDLLFEQGINDLDINIGNWNGVSCFFATSERSSIPYDIFSASFYLLSRYEEYLPHVKDIHGRFSPKDSLAFKHGFLDQPVVDIWAYSLLDALKKRFPNVERKQRKYTYISLIDVTSSHCYAHRGFTRSLAGFLLDLASFRLQRVGKRISVWFNPLKDPYDNFSWLVDVHKKYRATSEFFFQFAAYSNYDKNVSPNNNKFKFLIKSIADYSRVSLAASYSSFDDIAILKKEKKRLENVINRQVIASRMRYNRVDVPVTYRHLVEAGFTDDYTMGYTHEVGFRAGTCRPFYFYDINLEIQHPIKVHPFAVHDYALQGFKKRDDILERVGSLYHQVKKVNGIFATVFSNELLGSTNRIDWKKLYNDFLAAFNV